jgi:hypothetical protein
MAWEQSVTIVVMLTKCKEGNTVSILLQALLALLNGKNNVNCFIEYAG